MRREVLRRWAVAVALLAAALWAWRRRRLRGDEDTKEVRRGVPRGVPLLAERVAPDDDFIKTLFKLSREAQRNPLGLGAIKHFGYRRQDVIVVTKPSHVSKVLASSTKHGMGMLKDATQNFVGRKSLFALEGDEWRTQRVIIRNALHTERVQTTFTSAIESVSFRMVTKLAERIKSNPIVDVHAIFARMHVSVVTKAFFGDDFGFFRHELYPLKGVPRSVTQPTSSREEILDAFEYLVRELPKLAYNERFREAASRSFDSYDQNWSLHSENARVACRSAVRLRMSKRSTGERCNDILEEMITAQAEVSSSEDENGLIEIITDNIVQLIFAGFNTLTVGISFSLFYLVQNPIWWDRVRAEVDAVFLSRDVYRNRDVTSMEKMPFLNAVFSEALRLVPPTGFTARILENDVALEKDLVLPKGSDVFLPIVFLAQDTNSWGPDATSFNPNRWLEGNVPPPGAYIPFSAGPRSCIGENFARQSAMISLSMLIHFFVFDTVPGAIQVPRWTGFGYVHLKRFNLKFELTLIDGYQQNPTRGV